MGAYLYSSKDGNVIEPSILDYGWLEILKGDILTLEIFQKKKQSHITFYLNNELLKRQRHEFSVQAKKMANNDFKVVGLCALIHKPCF